MALREQTPYEAWYNKKAKCHLSKSIWFNSLFSRQFSERSKLNDKNKYVFVGYSDESKGYILILWIMNWLFVRMLYLTNYDVWNWEIAAAKFSSNIRSILKAITLVCLRHRCGRKWVLPIFINHVSCLIFTKPSCYEEAAVKEDWKITMKEEMNATEKNRTWRVVALKAFINQNST